jgi:hypothetical protein
MYNPTTQVSIPADEDLDTYYFKVVEAYLTPIPTKRRYIMNYIFIGYVKAPYRIPIKRRYTMNYILIGYLKAHPNTSRKKLISGVPK